MRASRHRNYRGTTLSLHFQANPRSSVRMKMKMVLITSKEVTRKAATVFSNLDHHMAIGLGLPMKVREASMTARVTPRRMDIPSRDPKFREALIATLLKLTIDQLNLAPLKAMMWETMPGQWHYHIATIAARPCLLQSLTSSSLNHHTQTVLTGRSQVQWQGTMGQKTKASSLMGRHTLLDANLG